MYDSYNITWKKLNCPSDCDNDPYCNQIFQGIQKTSITFQTHPQGGTYNLSKRVALNCSLSSTPSCYANGVCPYIYWTFNNINITANAMYHIISSTGSSELVIDKMNRTYSGVYACRLNDSAYSVQSIPAKITCKL